MSSVQHTIRRHARAVGIGLHSGEKVALTIKPAPEDTGIVFVRTDIEPRTLIPAKPNFVVDTRFATTIGSGKVTVSTIEHLMAAFAGAGVDNVMVEIDGPEVPVMDGSAGPFMSLIREAGLEAQKRHRVFLEVLDRVSVSSHGSTLSIEPSSHFSIDFEIDFDHPVISRQFFSQKVTPRTFSKRIAKARTFGFLKEVELMRKNGLARGGSLENAVVIGETSVLNVEGLRFSDEFVRHKVLDLIGDIYLLGRPVRGRLNAYKSGHGLHYLLVQELLKRRYAWKLVEDRDDKWRVPSWSTLTEKDMAAAVNLS